MTTDTNNQPNILFLMADQMAAPFVGAYGGPALTPNIDRLAANGVLFRSAYSNSPLCAPSRFSMMSGRLGSRIGAYDNASEFASAVPTFAHHLRRAGYQTSLVGKMHFVGADQLHGYEERLTTDIYPADFGWTPNWRDPEGRFDWWYHNLDSVVTAGIADATNQFDYDDDVGYQTIRKLRDLARTADDRPWMMTASFTHPHDPYVTRRTFWDRYDHGQIALPAVGPAVGAADDPHSGRLRRLMRVDTTNLTDEQVRVARHAYYANCSYVDDWVGHILDTLGYHAMADNTVVVFAADHGDMLGERGLWYKMNFFEHAARVPLIVYAPNHFAPSEVTAHVSLIDLAPTLIDLAGADFAPSLDGSTLLPLMGGALDPGRTVVGEYLAEGAVAPIFMIRRGDRKFIWSAPDGSQLFDLAMDPHEVTNMASDPLHAPEAAAFQAEVERTWDVAKIHADVLESQSNRHVVDQALRRGRYSAWDFQPSTDAAARYVRNHLDLNEVERDRRSR